MKNHTNETVEQRPVSTVVIPYIRGKSEKIRRINNKFNIRTSFTTNMTLRSKITNVKPRISELKTKNVVYKIPCECKKNYYGQTSRTIEKRIKEHNTSVRNHLQNYSKLSEHAYNENHTINWSEAEIIYKESNYNKRLIKEAACMAIDKSCISQPSTTIPPMFIPLIKKEVEETFKKSKPIKP